MKEIPQEIIDEFNELMVKKESAIRLFKAEGRKWSVDITLNPDPYFIHSPMIYPTGEFYQELATFFVKHGMRVTYNNTATTFWVEEVPHEQ